MNGVDVSWSVIEGDFGLARPGLVTPTVMYRLPPPTAPYWAAPGGPNEPGFFPRSDKKPGYGRLEIEPPAIVHCRRPRRAIAKAGRASRRPVRSPTIHRIRCRRLVCRWGTGNNHHHDQPRSRPRYITQVTGSSKQVDCKGGSVHVFRPCCPRSVRGFARYGFQFGGFCWLLRRRRRLRWLLYCGYTYAPMMPVPPSFRCHRSDAAADRDRASADRRRSLGYRRLG